MNIIDKLNQEKKLSKTWLAEQLSMSYHAFHYVISHRGLTEEEATRLETSVKLLGKELTKFKVPASLKKPQKP